MPEIVKRERRFGITLDWLVSNVTCNNGNPSFRRQDFLCETVAISSLRARDQRGFCKKESVYIWFVSAKTWRANATRVCVYCFL